MQKKNSICILISLLLLLFSCGQGVIPDEGPKNVVFTPTSAKVGDTITITGENFLPPEEMQWEIDNPDVTDDAFHVCMLGELVYFNVEITEKDGDGIVNLYINGTIASEYLEFGENKIVCKVPEGATTGQILVNGHYTVWVSELYHPSEEEFIVLDSSGDSTE